MELFDILSEFLNDKPELELLQTVDGQAFVGYLTEIFEKLNMLNKQLQGASKTLVYAKAKTFGFIAFLQLCQKNVSAYKSDQFYWLNKREVTDIRTLFNIKGTMAWLCDETETKYTNSTSFARKLLLSFPSS
jgi:hypothetical protein